MVSTYLSVNFVVVTLFYQKCGTLSFFICAIYCTLSIAIPDYLELPEPEIRVQTRRGVEVSYAPGVNTEVQRAS